MMEEKQVDPGSKPGMTRARKPPRWAIPFLRALERTGKARAAAEDAGVDHSTAYVRRKTHAEFAAAWEEALERFRAATDEARAAKMGEVVAELKPPHPSPSHCSAAGPSLSPEGRGADEREYVIASGQLKRVGPGRGSKAKERAFLAELAYSGSVRRACRAVGLSREALRQRRSKDPHFAAACLAAIEHARVQLNAFLVEAGNSTFDPDELPTGEEETPLPKVTVAEAIQIVKLKGRPGAEAGAGADPLASDEEVRDALLKSLMALGVRVAQAEDAWEALKNSGADPHRLGQIGQVQMGADWPGGSETMSRSCPHCRRAVFLSFPAA
jgi:hypothetical protein